MKNATLITVGIIAVFLVVLFLIFMSTQEQKNEPMTGSTAPDGTVFEGPSGPPPGVLRDESPQPQPQLELVDGDTLPTLE